MANPAPPYPRIEWTGDRAVLIRAGRGISRACQADVQKIFTRIREADLEGLRSLHPAYDSLLLTFDPSVWDPDRLAERLEVLIQEKDDVRLPEPRTVEIPVCYEGELAPDLEDVARLNGLSAEDVVRLHGRDEYRVYFLGFSPGFPYLGDMPKEIAAPRLASPRLHVPAGSVAIGGSQTGIYPVDSPGGWRLIGRTPLRLFAPKSDPPTLLQMGDRVRFAPISRAEFERLAAGAA